MRCSKRCSCAASRRGGATRLTQAEVIRLAAFERAARLRAAALSNEVEAVLRLDARRAIERLRQNGRRVTRRPRTEQSVLAAAARTKQNQKSEIAVISFRRCI